MRLNKSPSAENTIKVLSNIIAREGSMETLVCDNGPAFIDKRFTKFLKNHDIQLRHTTPLWPQANGEVERQNRSLLRRLRIAQALKLDWKEELLAYLMAYRKTPHSTTGVPPGNLFRGRVIKTKLPSMKLKIHIDDEAVRDNDRLKKHLTKVYADKKRNAKESDLAPGDKVLVRQKKDNKLSTPFSPEEHTVIWKRGNSVVARSPNGKEVRRNSTYFQRIKERDTNKVGVQEDNDDQDVTETSKDINAEIPTNVSTEAPMDSNVRETPTLSQPSRQKRVHRTPHKYNDFVLGLIMDCIHSNI